MIMSNQFSLTDDYQKNLEFLASDLLSELNRTDQFTTATSRDAGRGEENNEFTHSYLNDECVNDLMPAFPDFAFTDKQIANTTIIDTPVTSDKPTSKKPKKSKTKIGDQAAKETKSRKRKKEGDSEEADKVKKKSKTQFQRKNIKKIMADEKVNEITRKAIQEEQERQQRFNSLPQVDSLQNQQQAVLPSLLPGNNYCSKIPPTTTALTSESSSTDLLNTSQPAPSSSLNSSQQNQSDQSICIIDEYSADEKKAKTITNTLKDENEEEEVDDEEDDDVIEESSSNSDSTSNYLSRFNSMTSNLGYTSNRFGVTSRCNEENDDDDCRIISDSERLQEEQNVIGKKLQSVHMNDEFNCADENGNVLVNVNHPNEDSDVFLLPYLSRNVKAHQIGAIRFIYDNIVDSLTRVKNKDSGFGCILAHAMGLGKTLITISFIEVFLRYTGAKSVLCIVPINTIQNWLNEFNHWLPEDGQQKLDNDTIINYRRPFKVYMINDFAKTVKQRSDIILNWKNKGGVLMIGYEMFRTLLNYRASGGGANTSKQFTKRQQTKKESNDVIDLEEEDKKLSKQTEIEDALLSPCMVVCDEGHRIKNSSANIAKTLQQIRTKRRVVLTGYPLQNNLIEYWCMVNFVRPAYLGTKSEFSNMFERPITNGQCNDSTKEDVRLMRMRAHVLHSLLEGFVQRRGHDVFLNSLPRKQEFVILLKLSPVQKQFYLAFMEAIGAMNPGEKLNPLRTFAICCKIWNHPDVLYKYNADKEVDLDLDIPELPATAARASSSSSSKTAKSGGRASSNKTNAPSSYYTADAGGFNPFAALSSADSRLGKDLLDSDWVNRILESSQYTPDLLESGAKLAMAFSIVEQSILAGDKILLFSQSLLSLNLIEEFLQRMCIPNTGGVRWAKNVNYFRLDGSTSGVERERLIKDFNRPHNGLWLFLLSTRAGCLGINLIGANRVIVLDASWNPCHDAQAVCRVYRYGQTKNCYIYRLIADHTMEKKIYDRQISKQTMSDRVVDEIQAENHFTRTQVEKLIHYVKEDTPVADLSAIHLKYDDPILVNACLTHAHIITTEPFTHESLLIDKKEYALSEREKVQAMREYNNDKKYFPYNRPNNYSLYYNRFPSNPGQLLQNQMSYSMHHSVPLVNSLGSHLAYKPAINNNNLQQQLEPSNQQYKQLHSSYSYPSNMNQLNAEPSNHHHYHHQLYSPSPDNNSQWRPTISSNSDHSMSSHNSPSQQPQCSNHSNSGLQNLKDVKITSFISTSQLVIPTSDPNSQSLVIQPGEKVYILKTSKGVYLRTPEKKYIALKDKSIEDSFMPAASNSTTAGTSTNKSASLATSSNQVIAATTPSYDYTAQHRSSSKNNFQPSALSNESETLMTNYRGYSAHQQQSYSAENSVSSNNSESQKSGYNQKQQLEQSSKTMFSSFNEDLDLTASSQTFFNMMSNKNEVQLQQQSHQQHQTNNFNYDCDFE